MLDELGSWLNSRGFNNPERAALLDWLIHARKKDWDVYLVVQNIDMIDKQVRIGLAEYQVRLIRADKIKIPVVGTFLGKKGRLPKFHIANVSLTDVPGITIDREWFKGEYLHAGYDTLQIFRDWARSPADPRFKDELYGGPYTMLSAWHLKGRYELHQVKKSLWQRIFGERPTSPEPKPRLRAVALCSKLPPDEAWALARRYVQGVA